MGFESISKVVIGTLPSKRVIDFDDLSNDESIHCET